MIKTLKTKQFKITAFVLAVVLTLSCVFWNSTKVHALEIDGANVQTFNLDGSTTSSSALTSGSFSLFFNCGTDDDSKYVADCEKWTYTDGEWQFDATGTDAEQLLWKGGNAEVSYIATYPYRGDKYAHITGDHGGMLEAVPADQTDETRWNEFDVLWASGTTTDGSLDINFKHLYTKLQVNMTYGSEVEATQTVTSVTIGGTRIQRYFNYNTLEWTNNLDADIQDIKALGLDTATEGYGSSYEALILPQEAAVTITVEMSDGRVFTKTLESFSFQSGYQYNINLQVGGDIVVLEGITAEGWKDGGTINGGVAEKVKTKSVLSATTLTAEELKNVVAEVLNTGITELQITLAANASAEMFTAIREALVEADIADGSVDLTLAGVTAIPDNSTSYPLFGCFEEPGSIQMSEAVAELRSISLPDAVTVGDYAFYYCKNLTSLYAPKVQIVHEGAFTMTGLVTVELPEATTLEYIAFYECRALTSIKLPKVTTVGQLALDVVDPDTEVTIYLTADSDITLDEKCFWWVDNELLDEEVNLVLHTNKQSQVSGNTWTTKTLDGENVSFTFKSIAFAD